MGNSVKNGLHGILNEQSGLDYILSIRYSFGKMFFNTGEISSEESVLLHIVSGDCVIEALRDSKIEGGFSFLDGSTS